MIIPLVISKRHEGQRVTYFTAVMLVLMLVLIASALNAGVKAALDRHATVGTTVRYNIISTCVVCSGAAGHNKRTQHHSSILPLLFVAFIKYPSTICIHCCEASLLRLRWVSRQELFVQPLCRHFHKKFTRKKKHIFPGHIKYVVFLS